MNSMNIPKKDATLWFRFFASLPEDSFFQPTDSSINSSLGLPIKQQEIALAVLRQIERTVEKRRSEALAKIPNLHMVGKNGVCDTADAACRTLFVGDTGKFSRGCLSCLTGTGLTAIRKTNKCNIHCPFCYNYGEMDCQEPIGEGMWEIGGGRFSEEDIPLLLDSHVPPTGVSYVYLEPFMEIEKYEGIIRQFHQHGIHQHMYTNGTLATPENLQMLANAGLDELRFNLGATDCSDQVIESMVQARKVFRYVGIETPMTPSFLKKFMEKKEAILGIGLDFINCAELHLNSNNIQNYEGEAMYMSRLGYISPIWSRDISIQMMAMAEKEKWPLVVHDCSNHTKFARDLNLKAKEGGWFGETEYACEFQRFPFEAFLPTLEDENFTFVEEGEMPKGYRLGDAVI